MGGDAIRTEGLRRSFGAIRAVDGVDLAAPAGTVLGLLGPNGAGKTTIVRILTTLLVPDGGSAQVAGYDVVRDAEALEAGADGFLAKDASSRQVAGAIRTLVAGKGSVVAAAEPAARPVRDPSVDLRVRTLSGREREILGLLANGWSNRRIAEECFLSLNTVRTHVQNVLVKLGVHSKLEAVAFALEHQVVAAGAGVTAWAGSTRSA